MSMIVSSSHRLGFGRAAFLAASLALAAGAASAHDFSAGSLEIHHPWARATPPGAKVGGGYAVIENTGTEPDRLIGGSAEVADLVEVLEMSVVDGVMKMRPLEDGLEIPPGGKVELKPGSFHLMLMGLKGPMKEGESVAGSLTFEKAGTVDVTFAVAPIGAMSDGGDMHMEGDAPMDGGMKMDHGSTGQ
jgi:copper(I)-binding protein